MSDESDYSRMPADDGGDAETPTYCVWEITLECDLGCKHCGSRAGRARPDELSTEECLEVVDQLAELGIGETTLIGGEAYLRDDWTTIASALVDRDITVSVVTGAKQLSQQRVDAAAEAGISSISISIDGLEETHDALRGPKGTWQNAVDAARRVADSPMRLTANTQINRLSMPELPALADLLVDVGAAGWQVQMTVPMGRAADRPDLLLQPSDFLELFPLLVWIKQTKLDPADIGLAPSNNVGYFSPYERLLRWRSDETGGHWNACGAGERTLGLEADGKIKGCPSLPSAPYTGGNIRDDDIADVVADSHELNHLQERTVDDLWGFCKTCYYNDVCLAGCTWTSHTFFGRSGNNPHCIHRALEFEKKGLRERIVPVDRAEGDPFDFGRFEIVVEEIPDSHEVPSIVDMALDRVQDAGCDEPSLWDEETIKERLRRW